MRNSRAAAAVRGRSLTGVPDGYAFPLERARAVTATFAYARKAKSELDCPRPDVLTFHAPEAAVDSRLSSALELPLRCASDLPRARDLVSACLCLVRTSAASFSSCLLHLDALLLKHVASCSVPTDRKELTCSRHICAVFRVTLFLLGTVKTSVILLTIHGKVKSAHLREFREMAQSIAAFEHVFRRLRACGAVPYPAALAHS